MVASEAFVAARSADWARVTAATPADDPQGTGAFLRGLALFGAGEIERAAVEFRKSLRTAPDQVPAAFYLGACYAAGGRDREAIGAWQTVLAAEGASPAAEGASPAVYEHAIDAYLRLGDWDDADMLAREALEAWPDMKRVHLRRALALANAGKPAAALEAMEAHLAESPSDAAGLFTALRLIYEARVKREPVADELSRFERLYQAYRVADGAEQVLVGEWLAFLQASK
jgi:tetratricopeptide (TPR) repeat protein